ARRDAARRNGRQERIPRHGVLRSSLDGAPRLPPRARRTVRLRCVLAAHARRNAEPSTGRPVRAGGDGVGAPRGLRRLLRRVRRTPDQGVAAAAAGTGRSVAVRRRVHRLRGRTKRAVGLVALVCRRICAPGDGYPRPRQRLVAGRHARPGPGRRSASPGLPNPRRFGQRHALLPAGLHRRRARGRGGARSSRGRSGPNRGRGWQPGGRDRARGRRAGAGCGGGAVGCPLPLPHSARDRDHRRRAVPGGGPFLHGPPRSDRTGLRQPGLRRRDALRRPRDGAGPLLGRVDGPDLPAVDGVRLVQPLRWAERDPGLAVQPPRGRRHLSGRRETPIPGPALEL
ncbi:MAG: Acetyl xylan esterase, partial [uncultured Thermomicrobiales bacterium]